MKKHLQYLFSSLILFSCSNQEIKIISINIDNNPSMRGLYSVNKDVSWASGTKGVVCRFNKNSVANFTKNEIWIELDFRDIHAFNEDKAIIMSSGDGCEIYKTSDSQKTWKLVYENKNEGIFFDGMDFWDDKNGIAFSDPINGYLYLIRTEDGGDSWKEINPINMPKVIKGEAGFAASGTGIVCVGDSSVYIGTGGGEISRVFTSYDRGNNWQVVDTPMRKGEASGIYSMVFLDKLNGVAVGGNYLDSANTEGNCVITSDGGITWKLPKTPPTGYRSCVAYNGDGVLICTGRNGIDVSFDKGDNWKHISDDAYYSCVLNKHTGWLTGREGKVAKIIID